MEAKIEPGAIQPPLPVKENKWPKIVLFAVLGLILACGLVFAGIQIGKKKTPPVAVQPPAATSTFTPDLTANWKTYTNIKYEFSFKYPADYFKFQQESDAGVYLAPSQGEGGSSPKFLKEGEVWLNAGVDTGVGNTHVEDFLSLEYDPEIYANAQKVPTTIGGISGYRLAYDFPAVAGDVRIYSIEGLTIKNGNLYKITLSAWDKKSLTSHEATFNQILSTFKFLPERSRETINSWKEYEDYYKYSVKLPVGWSAMLGSNPSGGWKSEIIGTPEELSDPRGNSIGIHVFKEEEISDVEQIVYFPYYTQEQFNEWLKKEASSDENQKFYKVENIKISGRDAIKFVDKNIAGGVGPYYRIITWVRNNGNNYYISLGEQEVAVKKYMRYYNQILSTFKFLD